jgi:DNA primase
VRERAFDLIERGPRGVRASDFYSEAVLPALAERLDQAFPEFGWRRDARGWVATNEQHTHSRLGVRAERVVAHGPAPRGFLIHGGEPMLWTAYLNDGMVPRGADFVRVVRDIAGRAGVDASVLAASAPHDRRSELLRDFFDLCRRELAADRGAAARAYLEERGFPREGIQESGLGVVPPAVATNRMLRQAGYRQEEIAAAGVVADGRWPGRICGAWRDPHGRVGTMWARAVEHGGAAESRYLYLRGASRTHLPPYGLFDVLSRPAADSKRDVVIVEGFLDCHQLRARGVDNVAALGGTSIGAKAFEQLSRLGIQTALLCLDNDEAGRAGTARAIESAARARLCPDIYVVDPHRLTPAKDPDAFVRERGVEAWRELLERRSCGIDWRARELALVGPHATEPERRLAVRRSGRWLATLPPRLALEQEDALRNIAEQCGYSVAAVQRAFRARYLTPPAQRREPARSAGEIRMPALER